MGSRDKINTSKKIHKIKRNKTVISTLYVLIKLPACHIIIVFIIIVCSLLALQPLQKCRAEIYAHFHSDDDMCSHTHQCELPYRRLV